VLDFFPDLNPTFPGAPTMTDRTTVHRLQVATNLHRFIEERVLPGTGVDPAAFWAGFDAIVHDLAPEERRAAGRARPPAAELDAWHRATRARSRA
jgi:malate synthase